MTRTGDLDGRRVAAEEAAEWSARLESGPLTSAESEALSDWLRASPVHVAELLRADRLALALRHFESWRQPAEVRDNVIPLHPVPLDPLRKPAPRRRIPLIAVAASMLLLAIGISLWMTWRPSTMRLHTGTAERLEVRLDDGSTVRLEPGTDLTVRMRPAARELELQRGEAQFHVARDPARPFVVQAALARVEAVGTIFTVTREASTVLVSVSEGRVKVLPSESGTSAVPAMPLALDANERVRLSIGGGSLVADRPLPAAKPGWTELELAFDEVTVREAIVRFNRRNRQQVQILDPALADRRVSGFFNPDDPESFVEFLTVVAGARVTRSSSGDILVNAPRAAGP
jgi:transmembrane sensor